MIGRIVLILLLSGCSIPVPPDCTSMDKRYYEYLKLLPARLPSEQHNFEELSMWCAPHDQ